MTSKIVTAIVPVYRAERTLAQALSSLLAQDIDGLEIIVIVDGSPDRSAEIAVKKQAAGRGRLNVLQQSNCGLAATLNRGIGLARGRYIARQDAGYCEGKSRQPPEDNELWSRIARRN